MSSEWAIPALTQTSKNFNLFENSLRRHLRGVCELRIIDPTYRVPIKEITSKELNPKWTEKPAVESEGSSGSAATATDGTTNLPPQPDLMAPPQWIYTTRYYPEEVVETYSPSLDRADRSKNIPYTLLNQRCINLFARLLDRSLHHLLTFNETNNPHGAAASVFKNIKQHFSCSEWMNKDALTQEWEVIRVCSNP
jgi:hypothetical protein